MLYFGIYVCKALWVNVRLEMYDNVFRYRGLCKVLFICVNDGCYLVDRFSSNINILLREYKKK
jgi:hypothetical protein